MASAASGDGTAGTGREARWCGVCKRPAAGCACSRLPRIACGTRVVVIQHALERKSQSDTGALLWKVLADGALLIHGDLRVPLDLSLLEDLGSDPRVLFPLAGAPVVSEASWPRRPGRARVLVVLDATWSQARKMAQRIPEVRRLPFVRLPEGVVTRFRLRKPRRPGLLGTAEAAAMALDLLGETAAAAAVREGLSIVERGVLLVRGKIRRAPRPPDQAPP